MRRAVFAAGPPMSGEDGRGEIVCKDALIRDGVAGVWAWRKAVSCPERADELRPLPLVMLLAELLFFSGSGAV